jgi:hypothetical protein
VNTKNATGALGVLALALVFVAVWAEYRGIDFGNHWNEHFTLKCAKEAIQHRVVPVPRTDEQYLE